MRCPFRFVRLLHVAVCAALTAPLASHRAVAQGAALHGVPVQGSPDGAQLVREMHDRYAGRWYRTLAFRQATARRTAADTMVHETWYEAAMLPGRLRIDVGAPRPGGNPVILWANDSTYVYRTGHPLIGRDGRNVLLVLGFDVYTQPVARTLAELREEGIDLSRAHVTTWQGRRTYVIGAAAGDTTHKQFWVDAGRLLFVRLLDPTLAGRSATDIRFERYRPAGGGWVAAEVSAMARGKMVQHEAYSDIRTDVPLDSALFTPAALERSKPR